MAGEGKDGREQKELPCVGIVNKSTQQPGLAHCQPETGGQNQESETPSRPLR